MYIYCTSIMKTSFVLKSIQYPSWINQYQSNLRGESEKNLSVYMKRSTFLLSTLKWHIFVTYSCCSPGMVGFVFINRYSALHIIASTPLDTFYYLLIILCWYTIQHGQQQLSIQKICSMNRRTKDFRKGSNPKYPIWEEDTF